jgi:hypothetical protein
MESAVGLWTYPRRLNLRSTKEEAEEEGGGGGEEVIFHIVKIDG